MRNPPMLTLLMTLLSVTFAKLSHTTTNVQFSKLSTTGHSTASRRDPILLSFPSALPTSDPDKAHVLCTGVINNKSTYVESSDGGITWSAASQSVASASYGFSVDTGQNNISGSVNGIPNGYIKNISLMTGPWKTKDRLVYSINEIDNTIIVTKETEKVILPFWEATPNSVGLLAFDSGGVTFLGGTSYMATIWVWYSDIPLNVNHGNPCCNGSVVAYISNDNGLNWNFQSEIASKQSINEKSQGKWSLSQEGPNENDVVLLKDGVTIMCVIRIDGGDGVPNHSHVPYLLVTSVDRGKTWTMREAPKYMLSARPRAIVLPNGALVVTGGRPALSMWISLDGYGKSWKEYDIPTEHNRGVQKLVNQTTLLLPSYCSEFENATNKNLGWMQSSCYTRLGVLSNDTGIVCYEMQGAGSGGEKAPPPECAFEGSEIFCMRFTVAI